VPDLPKVIWFPDETALRDKLQKGGLRVKLGIDPTRPDLHLGHLVPLRLARKLQEAGNSLDLVLGTFTAQLGDPSGQDQTRPILSEVEVQTNAEKILAQASKNLLPGFRVHRNHTFSEHMDIAFFLTRLAGNFTVANMLSRDGFRERTKRNQPIALHELLVPLLQAWDSVVLKTEVEIGGTDQLFNFQATRSLQEAHGQPPEFCLMTPIIRGTDGRKMSKSFGNVILLEEDYVQMYGQIMSISDEVAEEWIPLMTDLGTMPEVTHPMERKKLLARELVTQLHTEIDARIAALSFKVLVQEKGTPSNIPEVKSQPLLGVVAQARQESNSRARELIRSGAVSINGIKCQDLNRVPAKGTLVKIGKMLFVRIAD